MARRYLVALLIFPVLVTLPVVTAAAGPIRLARHPDYHAGRIAFSYLGDIWTLAGVFGNGNGHRGSQEVPQAQVRRQVARQSVRAMCQAAAAAKWQRMCSSVR
jgi:hypothetical protein